MGLGLAAAVDLAEQEVAEAGRFAVAMVGAGIRLVPALPVPVAAERDMRVASVASAFVMTRSWLDESFPLLPAIGEAVRSVTVTAALGSAAVRPDPKLVVESGNERVERGVMTPRSTPLIFRGSDECEGEATVAVDASVNGAGGASGAGGAGGADDPNNALSSSSIQAIETFDIPDGTGRTGPIDQPISLPIS